MVRFTKMEGLGNDYIYLNNIAEQIPEERFNDLARVISDRHFGVGTDGLITILAPTEAGHDFRFRMFNRDGSEGEMCGNGMRCFARYCYDRGLTTKTKFKVQTPGGTVIPELILDESGQVIGVRVDLGKPRFKRSQMPMLGEADDEFIDQEFHVDGRTYRATAISTGNPHVVLHVDNVDAVDLEYIGPKIEWHELFPARINLHFAQVISRTELKMRTWERGSGITLACGTGASAVLAAAYLRGEAERSALVHLPGGDLTIQWDESTGHLFMTGPATYVCDGVFLKDF